jgi:surfeit locus 1 family protein
MRAGTLVSRQWIPITLLVIAASAMCFRLSVWQLQRLEQRRASNARIAYITSLPEVTLPSVEDLAGQEYRAVRAVGEYDFDNQIALRNQVRGSEYGFHLLTPLLVRDPQINSPSGAFLVDRGWIPAAGNQRPDDWRKYDVHGTVEVRGVLRMGTESAAAKVGNGVALAAGESTSRFALTVDPANIASQVGYAMPLFYIQATAGQDSAALPAAEVPTLDLGNGPHLGYAIQWLGFGLAILAGFFLYVRRQEASQ